MTRSDSHSQAEASALPSRGGGISGSHLRPSTSSISPNKVPKVQLIDNTGSVSHQSRRHAHQSQALPSRPLPRNHRDPLHTPPYIYTPCTPPEDTNLDPPTQYPSTSQYPKLTHDLPTPALNQSRAFSLCEDEFDLRVREMHEAARSLAAVRAVEQACLLHAQKMNRRRQRCLRRALELADTCFLSDEDEEDRGGLARAGREGETERMRKGKARWTVQQARATYERNWEALAASPTCPLSFSSIPWPVLTRPSGPASMTRAEVCAFLFGDLKTSAAADGAKRKERVKGALKRWHPDKFARYVRRVEEKEREDVLEAAGNVARCLNELL